MSYPLTGEIACSEPYLGPSLVQTCSGSQFLIFMSLLDTFIRTSPRISKLCERVKSVDPADDNYDFIVIGGGTAGAVVASQLSDVNNWKVLLLEAGPDEPPGASVPSMMAQFLGTEIDWQHHTTGEENACLSNNGSCSWPRGKNLGGTSVHHGMMYMRGNPQDYDNWEALGNFGWSWEKVLPYFLCMENNTDAELLNPKYHKAGGPLNVERFPWQPLIASDILKAAEETKLGVSDDLNGEKLTGFTVAQTTSKDGVRLSSARAFLEPVRNRSNLHIALNATATRIIFDNLRAVGVEYIVNNEQRTARASKEIIVSGGAVNSPQLLLLSGIGPAEHSRSVSIPVVIDLPGVGENLQNHVSYTLHYSTNETNAYDLNILDALEYVTSQTGPMSSTGLSQITGKLSSNYTTPDNPDIQFYFGGYGVGCATGEVEANGDGSSRRISISPTYLRPKSRGNLRLASNDPLAKPVIHGNYLNETQDADALVQAIEYAITLMNATALSKYNISLIFPAIEACQNITYPSTAYWNCAIRYNTGPENHQAGSCKMGPASDPMAVVDSLLKVRGVDGLRVADTSIMPTLTSGNTAAPAMMIGEKAAALIKQEWCSRTSCEMNPPVFAPVPPPETAPTPPPVSTPPPATTPAPTTAPTLPPSTTFAPTPALTTTSRPAMEPWHHPHHWGFHHGHHHNPHHYPGQYHHHQHYPGQHHRPQFHNGNFHHPRHHY